MIARILFLLALAHTTCAAMHPLDKKLIGVVKRKRLHETKALLMQGADPNRPNALLKRNALHYAVRSHNPKLTDLLLTYKANPNQPDLCCYTPLHEAAMRGTPDNIKLLVEHDAQLEAKTADKGLTPLLLAVKKGRYYNAAALCELNANVNTCDEDGWTAGHYAAINNDASILTILHAKGAQLNAQDSFGSTPLHYAARNGNIESVKKLLVLGASPTIKNDKQLLAHEVAVYHQKITCAKVIIDHLHQQALHPYNAPHNVAEEPTCPICLQSLYISDDVPIALDCAHVFHSACIFQWHEDSYNDCPVCRHKGGLIETHAADNDTEKENFG